MALPYLTRPLLSKIQTLERAATTPSELTTALTLASVIEGCRSTDDLFSWLHPFTETARLVSGKTVGPAEHLRFRKTFFLGPHGLTPLFGILHRLYTLLIHGRDQLSPLLYSMYFDLIAHHSDVLFQLVTYFRASHHRSLFDPPGFCDFDEALRVQTSLHVFEVRNLFFSLLTCELVT